MSGSGAPSVTPVVRGRQTPSRAFRQDAWPWALLAFGVGLRLLLAGSAMQTPERHLSPDSLGYLTLAENLCAGRGFSMATAHPWTPNTFRTPGYPAFIALVSLLVPRWPVDAAVITMQTGFVLVGGFALLRLASRLGFNARSRLALSCVLAFDPATVALSAMVLSETLFSALLAIVLLLWVAALQDRRPRAALLAGVSMGFALVKPIALYLWAALVLTLALAPGRRPRRWLQAALVITGVSCVALPWSLRHHRPGAGLSVSSMARSQMVEWQAAIIESRARGLPRAAVALEYGPRYGNEASGTAVLLDVISRCPRSFVSSSLASLGFFFTDPGHQVLSPVALGSSVTTSARFVARWKPARNHESPRFSSSRQRSTKQGSCARDHRRRVDQ